MLTAEQTAAYARDGFLVIEDFVTREACHALQARAEQLVEAWQPSAQQSVFTTNEQARVSNDEFLASGGGVWCFFEEEAIGPDGELLAPKPLAINKMGHAMHDLDPVFEAFTYTADLAAVALDVGLDDACVLQSMYIFKPPGIGGEVGCHQDATFLYTDPITVTGFWFALEDATVDNGCLWAAPGGHRTSLRKRFRRDGRSGTTFDVFDTQPLPDPRADLVPLETPAGTLVVLHGLLPHWSDVNRSSRSRHAYSVHCISGTADYPVDNWLQRPAELPLRSLVSCT